MGNLIFELDKYCEDKELIANLKKFNKNIRNRFVHKLLDPKISLSKMNDEAKNVYKDATKIVDDLADLNSALQAEEMDRKQRATKIITDCPEGVM
ncbi:MAG: hypothetical protein WC668_03195 [Patescibacteria group bacterium]